MKKATRIGAMLGMSIGLAATASADTVRVPQDQPTIQAGVNAAVNGDIVLVAPGVYQGAGNRDIDFGGKAITVRGDGGAMSCMIDCGSSLSDPHRAFNFHSGETAAAVVEGLWLFGGTTRQGAVADEFNGGAILCASNSSPTIKGCYISGNSAACWGGAVCCSSGAGPTIVSCTFMSNDVGDDGGAVFSWSGGHPKLYNCLIAYNSSGVTGGGLTNFGGQMTVVNCTIAMNNAQWGAGIYGNSLTMVNSIVRDNTGDTMDIRGSLAGVSYSNVRGLTTGIGNIDEDPLFSIPQCGGFQLNQNSPCIDAGNSAAAGIPATDLDGNPRFVDDAGMVNRGTGLPTVDIGAYEFQGTSCACDIDGFGVSVSDIFAFLSLWFQGADQADFDHNGTVAVGDIFAYLSCWFAGCPI